MNKEELRNVLDYDSGHLRAPSVPALVAAGRRSRRRRHGVESALFSVVVAAVVASAAVLGSGRGAGTEGTLVAVQPSADASAYANGDRLAEAGSVCRRALAKQGVLRSDEGHNVVQRMGVGWQVKVWPAAPTDVADGGVPPGPLWVCDVEPAAGGQSEALVASDVHEVVAPTATDLDASGAAACGRAERAIDARRYPQGRSDAEVDDSVRVVLASARAFAGQSALPEMRAAADELVREDALAPFLLFCVDHGYEPSGPGTLAGG